MTRDDQVGGFTRTTSHRHTLAIDLRGANIRPITHENLSTAKEFTDVKSRPKTKPVPALPRQNKSKVLKRSGLKKLPEFKPRKVKRVTTRRVALATCLVISLFMVFSFAINKRGKPTEVQKSEVKSATDTKPANPKEDQPTQAEVQSYVVAGDMPRLFRSKKLGINARIREVAITPPNISLPDNIFDIGWYKNGGKPGLSQSTLLVGSVSGQTNDGVFGRIGSVKLGDLIEIEMGDGTVYKYRVLKTKTYPKDKIDFKELQIPAQTGKEGLNIIAVANRFDVRKQEYESDFAVFAVKE